MFTIRGTTRITGVIGQPVAHSCSPVMHNAAFDALGMDWRYVAFEVAPASLKQAMEGMRALSILGLNVTIPHKPAVCALMDSLFPSAVEVEAVNTVCLQNGLLVGHNTDGEGFARSLQAAGVPLSGKRVVLIGAGGAARSVAAACLHGRVTSLTILNRTTDTALKLARLIQTQRHVSVDEIEIRATNLQEGEASVLEADLLVQCTSVGMHPHEDQNPPIKTEWLQPEQVVYDLIYNPEETRLLKDARKKGLKTINGVEMLVYQGAAAFEIWTGIQPPVDVMRDALLAQLRNSR